MIDTKKEQERDELHRAIWAIADELRGAVDGWDFKNYVLGTMFYRYISENLANYISEGEIKAGNDGFDYARMSDAEAESAREGLVQEKGFFILPSELFCNVLARCQSDENLNETLETVFRHIEESAKGTESEGQFAGLFDDFDVNSNKLGATVAKRNEKLCKLLIGVADMNLGDVKDHDIDAFGDAYEYLMTMYASNAGKSGGEFFTPADVSELLTRLGTVGKTEINKVYDPACGSGSLLLKAEKVLGKDAIRNGFYGQEINITTYNLCRINMFLHDIGFDKFDIACENTLTNPAHWDDEPFELIVSNPPYSIKWEGDDNPLLINDPRFSPAGVLAPKSKADMAFIMHSLSWLAANGTAAIVCFPGILYRGGAEQKIRRYLVENNFVDCIIQLPANLFFGTSIATCILVMKRGKSDSKTLFIDASNECIKVTNNNRLTPENIDRIVDTYAKRAEIAHFSHLAAFEEIEANDFNLSVSTYVEQEDKREKIDIVKLNAEIEEIVKRENTLRNKVDKIIQEMDTSAQPLKKRNMVEIIIDECNQALENGLFFAALSLALILPDVCGKAQYPNEGTKSRYIKWYEDYIGCNDKIPRFPNSQIDLPYPSGEVIYELRCNVFHQGTPAIKPEFDSITHFALRYETVKPINMYMGESSGYSPKGKSLSLHINILCWKICSVAKEFYQNNKKLFDFFNYELINSDLSEDRVKYD